MLPFGGHGSNMAIEDAGALCVLLEDVEGHNEIEDRLNLFERARKNRASRVQIMSKARIGEEKSVEAEVRSWAESPTIRTFILNLALQERNEMKTLIVVPTSHRQRTMHDYRYVLAAALPRQRG